MSKMQATQKHMTKRKKKDTTSMKYFIYVRGNV